MLVGYAGLGVPIEYLLAASLMAIRGILFARMLSPATQESTVEFTEISFSEKRPPALLRQRQAVRCSD